MLDARSFMISTLRSQVGFAATPRPLLTPVSAFRVLSSLGALAAPPAVTHICRARLDQFADHCSPTAFEQARGGAL